MLLLPGGMFHFGGGLRQVNAFLPGEKVVEHACGELLAQTGAVEDGFGGMVDEGRPIDAPGFILTEYHADTLPHEFPLELRPVMPCGLHGGGNLSGGGGGDFLVGLFPCGSVVHPPFEGSDARLLAEHGGLEGLADLVALPVGCRIGQAVILPPAVFPLHLVHRDAVKGKDGTVFAQCTETPLPGERADDSRQLPLEVAVPVTDGRQGQPLLPLLGRSRDKTELPFQLPADLHRTPVLVAIGNGTPGFVHPDGDDVQVLPPDVVVAIDDIGLVAEAHAPHILLRQADKPLLAQAILRVGIEGDVQDGFLGLAVGCEVVTERAGKMPYRVGVIALRLDNPAGEKHVGVPFVHLQLVVGKHPVQAAAVRDLGYHRTGYLLWNSSTSAEIRLLNSTSSRVCRSSL